ncbi:MAG TPA: cation:proton antiporter [Jatrophihabitans sp.]|nr:cation:proton antiporter [Jatrophihabitans sp.]
MFSGFTLAAAAPVASLGGHQLLVFLLQVGLLLGVALLLGTLAGRLGMPAVVGELAAGVLLGPTMLHRFVPRLSDWLLPHDAGQMHLLDAVGQLGVLLLVGSAGSQLDLSLIRRHRRGVGWVGAGALVIPLLLGVAAGLLLPKVLRPAGTDQAEFAAFIGVAICISAIPVIASALMQMGLFDRTIGQLIMGSAAVDDIAGWLLLSVLSATATTGFRMGALGKPVGYLALILLITVTVGRPVVRAVLRLANAAPNPGSRVAVVVVLLVVCGAGTEALGMEPILGAFLGGLLIGSSGQLDLSASLALRTVVLAVLAPLFFATAGLRVDLAALGRPAVLGAGIALLAVAVVSKFTGSYLGARIGRLSHWQGLALGAGLNARGVVELIVAVVGLRLGVLNSASYTVIVLIAVFTSMMAPPLLRLAVSRMPAEPLEVTDRGAPAARPGSPEKATEVTP